MKRLIIFTAIVAALLAWTPPSAAAPRHKTRGAGKEFSLPEAGIRIRVPAGVASQLLPSLRICATKRSDGTALYLPEELWRHFQILAVWSGPDVAVELARMEFPPPDGKDRFLSIADARRKWRAYSAPPEDAEVLRWAKHFFDADAGTLTELRGSGDFRWKRVECRGGAQTILFGYGENAGETYMYMFRLRWRGGSEKEWRRLAERCAVAAKKITLRKSETARSGTYAERLEQAKKSISGLRGWYVRETPNYIFVSNQRSRGDMRRLQTDLELAREIFVGYFPGRGDRCTVGVVKLFAERGEYLKYVGGELKWTAGVWMPAIRELVVSPLGMKTDDKIVERYLRNVTLHEGFHQYIFYACSEVNPALWINEGCAQFFETSLPRQGEVGLIDKRTELKLAQAAAAGHNLARFVRLDHKGFYAEGERELNYALAHALCYYLLRGAPALGEAKYAAIPMRYMDALRRTRDLDKAREHAFAGIDLTVLENKHKAFWRSKSQLQKAKHYRRPAAR